MNKRKKLEEMPIRPMPHRHGHVMALTTHPAQGGYFQRAGDVQRSEIFILWSGAGLLWMEVSRKGLSSLFFINFRFNLREFTKPCFSLH